METKERKDEINLEIILSICIPTYNRANLLKKTIESVIPQLNERVELIISDNCSSDNTEEIVLGFLRVNNVGNINYLKNITNVGLDGNIINLLNKARGDFVFFLADDDYLIQESVPYILNLLKSTVAVMYLNYYTISHYDSNIFPYPRLSNDLYYADKNQFLSFLLYNILFISSIVVNKKLALSAIEKYNLVRFSGSYQLQGYIVSAVCSMKPQDFYFIFTHKHCVIQTIDLDPPSAGFYIFGTKVVRFFKDMIEFGYDRKLINRIINKILFIFVAKGLISAIGKNKYAKKDVRSMFKDVAAENKSNAMFWLLVYPISIVPEYLIRKLYSLIIFTRNKVKKK
jgi:abequosyltransferase